MSVASRQAARQLISSALESFEFELHAHQIDRLVDYAELVIRWNQHANLTGAQDARSFVREHIIDSLSVVPHIRESNIADIGSGVGLPAVVLAVCRPEVMVTAVEPRAKRHRFLTQSVIELGLENLAVAGVRAEQLDRSEVYEGIISRAVARFDHLLTMAAPLVAEGGRVMAMKAVLSEEEIDASLRFGGALTRIALSVPGFARRELVVWRSERAGESQPGGADMP